MQKDLKVLLKKLLKFVFANAGRDQGKPYQGDFQLIPVYWSLMPAAEQQAKRAGLPLIIKTKNW